MIPILYEATETAFTSNGIARLSDTISATVTEERNGRFDMEFQYPVNGIHFDDITEGRIVAVTHDEDGDIQPFVIYSSSKPIDGVVTFNAYHLSYRLSDYVPDFSAAPFANLTCQQVLNKVASGVNTVVDPFTFTTNKTGSASKWGDTVPKTCREWLGGVEGSILDTFGGEYEFDKWDVKLLTARGSNRGVTIRYGKNLSDFKAETDYSGAFTNMVAYFNGDYTEFNIQPPLNKKTGVIFVTSDSGHTLPGGRKATRAIDFSSEIDSGELDINIIAKLSTLATAYWTDNEPWNPSVSIDVDFVQLWQTEEYKDYAPLLKCKLCDTVNVTFPFYGLSDLAIKIVSVEWDVLNERYKKMTLGGLATTLSQSINSGLSGSIQANADAISAVNSRTWVSDVTVNGTSVVTDGVASIAPTLQSAAVSSPYTGSINYMRIGRMVTFDATIATSGALANGTTIASGLPANHTNGSVFYALNNNSTSENVGVYVTNTGDLKVRGAYASSSRSLRVSGAYISAS